MISDLFVYSNLFPTEFRKQTGSVRIERITIIDAYLKSFFRYYSWRLNVKRDLDLYVSFAFEIQVDVSFSPRGKPVTGGIQNPRVIIRAFHAGKQSDCLSRQFSGG